MSTKNANSQKDHDMTRIAKAEKILSILRDFIGYDLSKLNCLDVGCSNGTMLNIFENSFNFSIGIDDNSISKSISSDIFSKPTTSCVSGNGLSLPFPPNTFDVLICAQVYEHVFDPFKLAQEVYRVTKLDGVVFFSGPNRLAIIEEHYWLPFLSWLPKNIADIYMRLFKKGRIYDIQPFNFWQLRKLWRMFDIYDYTLHIFKKADQFYVKDQAKRYFWLLLFPNWLLEVLKPFYPNFNWILCKSHEKL